VVVLPACVGVRVRCFAVPHAEALQEGEPNKILFVQNLPESAPPAAITAALKQVHAVRYRVCECILSFAHVVLTL
jgi:hypothetical protein